MAALRRWWSQKHKLPPNHPLFLEQSAADLNQEMIEDLLLRKIELEKELENIYLPSRARLELGKQLQAVQEALGEKVEVEDDLVDQWDRDLAEGRIPNLEA